MALTKIHKNLIYFLDHTLPMFKALDKSAQPDFALGFQSIYFPKIRDYLRDLFKERSVLMMDLDGVLTAPGQEKRVPYPPAIEALRELDRRGYILTLFTQASDRFMDVSLFLRRAKIGSLFSVVVTEENQELKTQQQKSDYRATVDSAEWLDEETRRNFKALADMKLFTPPKPPHLFMEKCGIIEDAATPWYKNFSPAVIEAMQRKDGRCPYPLFEVADTREDVDPKISRDPDEYFGPAWVEKIMKEFPVRS